MCIPSPVDTDIFRISEVNVLDDRRRSANAIRPKLQGRYVKWMNGRETNKKERDEKSVVHKNHLYIKCKVT